MCERGTRRVVAVRAILLPVTLTDITRLMSELRSLLMVRETTSINLAINCLELNQIRTHEQAHTHLPCDVRHHDWHYYNHCAIIGAFKIQLSLNAA